VVQTTEHKLNTYWSTGSLKSGSSLSPLEAKFHYAILVADRSEAGRRPAVARC